MPQTTIYNMDVLQGLVKLSDESVDCIVTSPPYWALRDYGVKGQIGLEPTYQEYIAKLLEVTKQLKRVLKPSGTLWLNISDTYPSGGGKGTEQSFTRETDVITGDPDNPPKAKLRSIKGKCKIMIPERLAIKMTDDQGWFLRNDIIWHKSNHMPEAVKDRLTKSYEHLYFFTKSQKYYFDLDSIREKHTESTIARLNRGVNLNKTNTGESPYINQGINDLRTNQKYYNGKSTLTESQKQNELLDELGVSESSWLRTKGGGKTKIDPRGKNPGDVWVIATKPFKEAHFATYPKDLPERCIKAGSPKEGVVLDPFAGSGTTLEVAKLLRRDGIGIEINPKYVEIIKDRLHAKELLNKEEVMIKL